MRAEADDAIDEPVLQIEGMPANTEGEHSDGANGRGVGNGAAEGGDSVDESDGATSEDSGPDKVETAQRAENYILRERIRGMIEAEADPENDRGAYVFDAEDDEDCYDDGYPGMVAKLKEVISTFPVDGDLRVLRDWHLQLGDVQNDDCGVDDLDGAKDAYTHAKRLSLLIAKDKTIAKSTADNTIDKSAQSVLLVEGASSNTGIPEDRGHFDWSTNDDELLAAGTVQLPSGCAHRWRDIAKLVGKTEEACRSRARCDAFIKVHLRRGENEEDKLEGAARQAPPELDLDGSRESVVVSGAEDDTFNGQYFRSHTEDRKPWEDEKNDLVCYKHTSVNSEVTYLWRDSAGSWCLAYESIFHTRTLAKCLGVIESSETTHAHPARVSTWITSEIIWEPGMQTYTLRWESIPIKVTAELDLNDSIASGVKIDEKEGLKVEADETKSLEANFEDGGPDADSAGAPQDESDDYSPPSNLAGLFDMMGMPNYAALTRWLDDHDPSGLRIVAREGLDEDADDSPESFLKLGILLHEEGNLPAAERAFRMAISGRPMDPEPYLYFGKMLEESGRVLEAETMYRRATLVVPAFPEELKLFRRATHRPR